MERCMNQRPHHIDGREVEAKIAVPREEQPIGGSNSSSAPPVAQQGLRTKKVWSGVMPRLLVYVFITVCPAQSCMYVSLLCCPAQ